VEQFLLGATGVKEYLKSASSMVGKMSSQNYCGDEASDNMKLITDQNEKD
jgi:hypothetical protein